MSTGPRNRCRIERAVEALAGPLGKIITHSETAWASMLFSGSRHALTLEFRGAEGFDAAKDFVSAVLKGDWAIPSVVVADSIVPRAAWQLAGNIGASIDIELLLLHDEGAAPKLAAA